VGRIVVTEFVSLDGVAQAPGGEDFRHKNWSFAFDRGKEGEQFKLDEALGADALLLGRRTYEGFAAAWPQYEGELADKYNSMPKYVVSTTLTEPAWNNTRVLDIDQVARLRDEVAGDISVPGSLRLVQGLLVRDLVDEIHLMTFPVLLGTGRRLFGDTPDKSTWTLAESRTVGDGVLITILRRVTPE
jgi:dihydrofolate reductase